MYTMKQVCQEVGMTYETLKFYCNVGLVPNVKRDKNNHRIFDERDISWIRSLSCLKKCGMSIETMKNYCELCKQGQSTIPERKKMLAKQQEFLLEQLQTLNASLDYINWKQWYYDDVLAGKVEYINRWQ